MDVTILITIIKNVIYVNLKIIDVFVIEKQIRTLLMVVVENVDINQIKVVLLRMLLVRCLIVFMLILMVKRDLSLMI